MPPCERMLSSAISSSSRVLIPTRTEARSSSRVWPTSSPATRILAIWSGVLISIPRSRQVISGEPRSALVDDAERGEDPLGDLVDLAETVDLDQQTAAPVDVDQRLGLLGVDL